MVNFRWEQSFVDALDKVAKAHRRSRTAEVEVVLIDHIRTMYPDFQPDPPMPEPAPRQ